MARLQTLLGDWPEDEDTVTAFADSMKNEFEVQRNLMEASDKYAGASRKYLTKGWKIF